MTIANRFASSRLLRPFDLDDIAVPSLWLSAASPTFYELDGSSNVETAIDRGFRAQHATQATASARPPLVTHGGMTWFDFSQGNDYLSTAPVPATTIASVINLARSGVASVYLPYGSHTSARRVLIETYPEWYGGNVEIDAGNDLSAAVYDGNGVETAVETGVDFPLQTVQIVGWRWQDAGSIEVWRQGVSVGSDVIESTPSTANQTGWRIGTYRDTNGRWFDGYLGELFITDRFLADAEMVTATEVLDGRWA